MCIVNSMNSYLEAHTALRGMSNLDSSQVLDDAEKFITAVTMKMTSILTRFGYIVPEVDFTTFNTGQYEKLVSLKAEIQTNFNTTLTVYQKTVQKNYRRIDELTNKISNMQPGKNASEESRKRSEAAIAELAAEIETLKTDMKTLFTAFYAHRVCEESFRNIPNAYLKQTPHEWYWAYLHLLRILPSIHHANA